MITKRMLGIGLLGVGLLLLLGAIGAEITGAGLSAGFGPVQRRMIGGGLILILLGITLWPLGKHPA